MPGRECLKVIGVKLINTINLKKIMVKIKFIEHACDFYCNSSLINKKTVTHDVHALVTRAPIV